MLQSMNSRVSRLQELQHTDLVALQHVGSSRTRDRTHVPCTGRQILNHWATREVPAPSFNIKPWAQTFGFWGALCLYQLSQSLPSSIFLGLFHSSPPSVCKYTWAVSRKLVRPFFKNNYINSASLILLSICHHHDFMPLVLILLPHNPWPQKFHPGLSASGEAPGAGSCSSGFTQILWWEHG